MKHALMAAVLSGMCLAVAPVVFAEEPAPAAEAPKAGEPVDFRKLKELMPAELGGLKRTQNNGQRISTDEMTLVTVEAAYSNEADAEKESPPSISLNVLDYGKSELTKAASAWTSMKIDNESDTGYQKTTKVQDCPAMEQYDTSNKQGSLMIVVSDRMVINLTASNMPVEQFKKLGEALPLKKIAELVK